MISHEHILLCSQPPWSSYTDAFYPTACEHSEWATPHTVQWIWVWTTVFLSTTNRPHPTAYNEGSWMYIVICAHEYLWVQNFLCNYFPADVYDILSVSGLYPAFSFSSWPQQSLSSWRGWVVADSLQKLSLIVTTPWQGRLSSATRCSDKKENMLLGSSPSSAKRKSLD